MSALDTAAERATPRPADRARDAALARILLVQAFETADPEGRFLSGAERRQAGRDARVAGARDPVALLAARAEALARLLVSRVEARNR